MNGNWLLEVVAITVGVVLAELAVRMLAQRGMFPPQA